MQNGKHTLSHTRKTKGPTKKGFTPTQTFILKALKQYGKVVFGAGDRRGTRIAFIGLFGFPLIKAYSNPEYFLEGRGLIEKAGGNYTRFTYKLTAAGEEVVRDWG